MYGILCPLKLELSYLKSNLDHLEIPMAVGGHGKVNYAIKAVEFLKTNSKVRTLICVGAGGAIDETVNILDVVVATETVEHDYIEKFNPKATLPRWGGSEEVIEALQNKVFSSFKLHTGIIASGDEDIMTRQRALEIKNKTQALAVAWEGMGGAKSCRHLGRHFIEVRGITDNCSGSVDFDFKKNLEASMKNCAEVIKTLIQNP